MKKKEEKNREVRGGKVDFAKLLKLLPEDTYKKVIANSRGSKPILEYTLEIEHINFNKCNIKILELCPNYCGISFENCTFNNCFITFNNIISDVYFKNDKFNNCRLLFHVNRARFAYSSFIKDSTPNSEISYLFFPCTIGELNFYKCDLKYLMTGAHGISIVNNLRYTPNLEYLPKGKNEDAIITRICPLKCPEEGSFIGWKKIYVASEKNGWDDALCKLEIPEDALRSSGGNTMCRANKVKVLDIVKLKYINDSSYQETDIKVKKGFSIFNSDFVYEVGKIVKCEGNFDMNRFNMCSSGIHFFLNKEEAINY